MDADSPITARLIFWPVDRDAVWLKAQFTPTSLTEMCHNGDCPLEGFLGDARDTLKNSASARLLLDISWS